MNIILLGAPGSGKGTQAEIIAKEHSYHKLSTGDLIRDEIKSMTPLGIKVKNIVEAGEYVSDDIMIELVEKKIAEVSKKNINIIFDGFPRTLNQANKLDNFINKYYSSADYAVVNLHVTDEEIIKRVSGRFSCANCGAGYHDVYHKTSVPNKCDHCGSEEFNRRKDDEPESVKKRVEVYKGKFKDVVDYYKDKNLLKEVDGMQEIGRINADIMSCVEGLHKSKSINAKTM